MFTYIPIAHETGGFNDTYIVLLPDVIGSSYDIEAMGNIFSAWNRETLPPMPDYYYPMLSILEPRCRRLIYHTRLLKPL